MCRRVCDAAHAAPARDCVTARSAPLAGMVTQLVIMPAVTESVSERTALVVSGAVSAVFYLAYATAVTATQLVAISVPLVVANTVFQLINTSQVTRVAAHSQRGLVVSLDMALFSAVRIPMPAIATALLQSV